MGNKTMNIKERLRQAIDLWDWKADVSFNGRALCCDALTVIESQSALIIQLHIVIQNERASRVQSVASAPKFDLRALLAGECMGALISGAGYMTDPVVEVRASQAVKCADAVMEALREVHL